MSITTPATETELLCNIGKLSERRRAFLEMSARLMAEAEARGDGIQCHVTIERESDGIARTYFA
jgi:hypothetical protein